MVDRLSVANNPTYPGLELAHVKAQHIAEEYFWSVTFSGGIILVDQM